VDALSEAVQRPSSRLCAYSGCVSTTAPPSPVSRPRRAGLVSLWWRSAGESGSTQSACGRWQSLSGLPAWAAPWHGLESLRWRVWISLIWSDPVFPVCQLCRCGHQRWRCSLLSILEGHAVLALEVEHACQRAPPKRGLLDVFSRAGPAADQPSRRPLPHAATATGDPQSIRPAVMQSPRPA